MANHWIRTIRPEGDRCLIVELGNQIDETIGRRARQLAQAIEAAGWPEVIEVIAAFGTVAIFVTPVANPSGEALADRIHALTQTLPEVANLPGRKVTLPVCYDARFGIDLEKVAAHAGLSVPDLIAAHQASVCQVFTLGFSPGLPYLGVFDERFDIPRLKNPRMKVSAGSVGIANRQAVVYPRTLPGGWNLIGATPIRLFDPTAKEPSFLKPGDEVTFKAISVEEFEVLQLQAQSK
jgi:KipI family sensor histidine kinase inhibitor